MQWIKTMSNDNGAVLIGAIVVLVAVTVIGVTLITISNFEVDMSTNEKCKEEARYNSESCAASGIKLIKMVSKLADEQGVLGIAEGDSDIPGITYADADTASTKEAEFARKVLGDYEDNVCEEDFDLSPASWSMDASGDIQPAGATANPGTAANRQVSGYSYGIGLGGASGGGFSKWFILACRGGGCGGNARNVSYARYKRVPGIEGGM